MPAASDAPAAGDSRAAAPGTYGRLTKRTQFLTVAKGLHTHSAAFVLQCACNAAGDAAGQPPRFGFTISKKNGNSVVRNRIRRRLRAALRQAFVKDTAPQNVAASQSGMDARAGCDYVIVARPQAVNHPFAQLVDDLRRAVGRVHEVGERRGSASGKRHRRDRAQTGAKTGA